MQDSDNATYFVFDYETFSEADIKKTGAWEYSVHPSTEILCLAFRMGTREELKRKSTLLWVPGSSQPHYSATFPIVLSALRNPKIRLVARNALFEQVITKNVFAKKLMPSLPELQDIPISRWYCTAALTRVLGLPGSLEVGGAALGLEIQKDTEGKKIMMKVCRPKKPSQRDPSTRHQGVEDMEKLYAYCKRDVDSDTEAFLKLPPMHPAVREFWELDQKVNLRGFAVDRELVKGAIELIDRESVRLDKRVKAITKGQINSARQRAAVLKFVKNKGFNLPDLKGATVKEVLKNNLVANESRELLEIREAISRSSTAKYKAFEIRSRYDGRARDNLIFNGPHTGRDAGTGLQPQNLFKTILKQEDVEAGLELMRRRDVNAIEALYEKPMDLYASALRSCIVAGRGNLLEVGDFATVEVRGLFWLAGHTKGLEALAKGIDIYCEQAEEIYEVPADEIKAGHKAGNKVMSFYRQLGKQTVLGGGFGIGLGGEKFQLTCKQYGMDIPIELAQKCVAAYRKKHPRIPAFWSNLEKAARLAIENPGKGYRVGHLVWRKEGDFLTVQLPIGRKIHYFKPELRRMKTLYGTKVTICFLANIQGKLYRETTWGGKLAENVTQGLCADLLKCGLVRLENAGHPVVLAVHDEAVCENDENFCDVEEFENLMAVVPEWAPGFPVAVEGWAEARYRK